MGRFVCAWEIESLTRLPGRIAMAGVLDYENVTKDYGVPWSRRRVRALDGFTLSLERGEIFGFLGPNGAGKTTAIHLALGFMRPTSGAGHLLGKPFGDAASRGRIGFLAENVALYHRPAAQAAALLRRPQPHAAAAVAAASRRGAASGRAGNGSRIAMSPSFRAACSSASAWRRR